MHTVAFSFHPVFKFCKISWREESEKCSLSETLEFSTSSAEKQKVAERDTLESDMVSCTFVQMSLLVA